MFARGRKRRKKEKGRERWREEGRKEREGGKGREGRKGRKGKKVKGWARERRLTESVLVSSAVLGKVQQCHLEVLKLKSQAVSFVPQEWAILVNVLCSIIDW